MHSRALLSAVLIGGAIMGTRLMAQAPATRHAADAAPRTQADFCASPTAGAQTSRRSA